MKEDRERILGAGFNGYLSKPIDAVALLAELHRFFSPAQFPDSKPAIR